jgi:hypothetical protein
VRIEPEIGSGYPDRIVPKHAASAAKAGRAHADHLYNQRSQWTIDIMFSMLRSRWVWLALGYHYRQASFN